MICTVCVISVTAVHIVDTVKTQSREDSQETDYLDTWADSIDNLNKYGGTIYYGTASSQTINDVKTFTGETSYKNSSSSAKPSGTYGYKVSVTKTLIIVEWKSYSETVTNTTVYSSGPYQHTVNFTDNSMSIPIDSVRAISISHTGTK